MVYTLAESICFRAASGTERSQLLETREGLLLLMGYRMLDATAAQFWNVRLLLQKGVLEGGGWR